MTTPVNRRILVIDDNEVIHSDFYKILCPATQSRELADSEAALFGNSAAPSQTEDAFLVDGALQGKRGHEMACQAVAAGNPYAVAFVDMRMPPGWDGVQTIEHLWKADPQLQVVICTAFSDYSWDQIIARLGRSDNLLLLKKPFDNVEVRQMACSLTEKWDRAQTKLRQSEQLSRELRKSNQDLQRSNQELQREVRDRRAIEQRLRHSSLHDDLTGLSNRSYLRDRIEQCIQRRRRQRDYRFAVLFLDIDNFKLINDSLGHQQGDELLVQVANRLQVGLRSLDTITRVDDEAAARIGGDEFVILLEDLSRATDSALVAQRLLEQVSGVFELTGTNVTVAASIGITVSDHGYETADEVLRDADTAMYRAKTAGKGRYAVFDPDMHRAARRRLQLENDLRRAIPNNELRLVYQPIVELGERRVVGLEALLRWDRSPHVESSPGFFIQVAEESGLIIPIGRWVLDTAASQLRTWRQRVSDIDDLSVNVNVSRRQLLDSPLADVVTAVLASTHLPPACLNLEVTEGGVIEDFETASMRLKELKGLSVGLHMDDFGTGYSSLSCLHRLPFDIVKIDRSFTTSMRDNASYGAVVRAVVAMARTLRMKVTVEGVESVDQLELVTQLGCDFAQGFLFSPPVDAGSVVAMLRSGSPLGATAQRPRAA